MYSVAPDSVAGTVRDGGIALNFVIWLPYFVLSGVDHLQNKLLKVKV